MEYLDQRSTLLASFSPSLGVHSRLKHGQSARYPAKNWKFVAGELVDNPTDIKRIMDYIVSSHARVT